MALDDGGPSTSTSLTISADAADVVFVTPLSSKDQQTVAEKLFGRPAAETLLTGRVSLRLAKPRTVKRLCVEVISKQYLVIGTCAHTFGTKHCSTDLLDQPVHLAPGTYEYPFAVVLPAKAASSDISYHGRTMNRLAVMADGLGPLGRKMVTEIPLNIVSVHYDPTGLPPSFSLESNIVHDQLGPTDLHLSSNYLLVAGFAHLALRLQPFHTIRLLDARVSIIQQTELTRLDNLKKEPTVHTDVIPVWEMSASSPPSSSQADTRGGITVEGGAMLELSQQMRLPTESKLLPTTPDSAASGLRIYHRIEVTLDFALIVDGRQGPKQDHTVASEATFSSCHCTLEALQLPAYASQGAGAAPYKGCLCTVSDEEALSMYRLDNSYTTITRKGVELRI